jgi:hypothetical protein
MQVKEFLFENYFRIERPIPISSLHFVKFSFTHSSAHVRKFVAFFKYILSSVAYYSVEWYETMFTYGKLDSTGQVFEVRETTINPCG